MEDQVILLQDFILNAPTSNSEHIKQINRLKDIVSHYEKKVNGLKAEIKKLREESED